MEQVFEDTLRAIDPTRMARQADPTTVGQRHGPYHFDVASGSGYDAWGGRWPMVSSCASSNYETAGCCNDTADKAQAGCRYNSHDGGPGDPFEWSEFGSNAMSDIQTLRYILPATSLTPTGIGDRMWQVHKAGMCVCTPDPCARPRTHHLPDVCTILYNVARHLYIIVSLSTSMSPILLTLVAHPVL